MIEGNEHGNEAQTVTSTVTRHQSQCEASNQCPSGGSRGTAECKGASHVKPPAGCLPAYISEAVACRAARSNPGGKACCWSADRRCIHCV